MALPCLELTCSPRGKAGLALPSMAWSPLENGTIIKKEGPALSFGARDVRRHKPGSYFGEEEQAEDGRGRPQSNRPKLRARVRTKWEGGLSELCT